MSNSVLSTGGQVRLATGVSAWTREYIRRTAISDFAVAAICSTVALQVRFDGRLGIGYVLCSFVVPLFWLVTLSLSGAYNVRCIGTGSDEFRKVLNAGFGLTAALAILSYAINTELSREYLLLTMPTLVGADLCVRYAWRKRLHRRRAAGQCMSSVLAVGPEPAVFDLITELRRGSYHGLTVVAACVRETSEMVADIPVFGGLAVADVVDAVSRSGADTVAVLSSSELDSVTLRQIAWGLEKTGTALCVAPALLDVAGPRTTIRPIAGLTLLHVDHPQLSGPRQVLKDLFDRSAAALALALLAPLMIAIAMAIKFSDPGPALFTQTRVGKDGRLFKIYKFRTMVVDAEKRFAELRDKNDNDGAKFKMRRDPRVTTVGAQLRKWSMDELPQLFNILLGEMSLVGPRPALPDETARYAAHVHRRLAVRPGLTGLWQVSGRSDLTWDESVRLDLRYVENWSLALDLQILWKTFSVILSRSGAY
jgi:exopolysaccharide biosynthesis polyprenyl glycosylphosphotransferase